jgi:hypothetical protein
MRHSERSPGAYGGFSSADAVLRETAQERVEVLGDERHVVVALAEVVGFVAADVDGQLEHVSVAGQAEVDVVGRVEVQLSAMLESQPAVELG